ncbi:response regulator transcription factor [Marinihelvus fidelis]|uniref:Response regulator transcription factor n=1 Tax=Marinihelvus fidelis TaxID=2613842 RepID=A0A5N0T980_9GAMM|nr:LytTR family DNA-binding domain-containing protein [Marinihelvus fidelis]KAA9131288.1 response regulator transcription factor [Marinihelvus fidelis]
MTDAATRTLDALIVDDEALARRGLRHRLDKRDGIQIIGEARNGREAVEKIRQSHPDVVFLDIQMPGMNGFEVIRELRNDDLPAILFVTAYDEYAIDAFEVNAVDYLLKPIDDERLDQALEKVRSRLGRRRAQSQKNLLLRLLGELTGQPIPQVEDLGDTLAGGLKPKELPKLAIRDGGKTTWVRQQDIEWIDAAGDYMCVHADGETHIMRKTMKELESELEADFLQRIHRSTIVNVNRVTAMQSHINGEYFLTLEGGHTVKLSRSYKEKLKYLT